MDAELIVTEVALPDGTTATVRCRDGTIAAVTPASAGGGPETMPDATIVDAAGWVLLPRLVDAHVHLDKTLLGSRWFPHREAASLAERIATEAALLDSVAVEPTATRAGRLIGLAVAHGATTLQSHVDVSGRLGLSRLEAVVAAREAEAGRCDVRLVAFPQEGVTVAPGTAATLESAVRHGCDAVGGLDPAGFDGDRDGQLNAVFGIADRNGCRVDIHLHEAGQTGIDTMLAIAERCRALGMGGAVCVSHAYALAQVPASVAAATAAALACAGVSLVSSAPGRGLMPPLRLLAEHGVTVAVASDNVRDSWWPYGKADPLERACTAGYLAGWLGDDDLLDALAMVTYNPARILGLAAPSVAPGSPADFTLAAASSVTEALVAQPAQRVVVKGGRVVAGAGHLAGTKGAGRAAAELRAGLGQRFGLERQRKGSR